jgi:Undecaprenyl-phosphate galactose phosphotransferase WbaP
MDDERAEDNAAAIEARNTDPSATAATDSKPIQSTSLDPNNSRIKRLALAAARGMCKTAPSILLMVGDLTGLVAAGQMGIWLRHLITPAQFGVHPYPVLLAYSGLMMLTYLAVGLYGTAKHSGPEELRRLTLTTTTLALAVIIVTYVSHDGFDIHVAAYLIAWAFALFTVPISRAIVRGLFSRRHWWGCKAIVLSHTTDTACRLVQTLREQPRLGLWPTVILTTGDDARDHSSTLPGLTQLHAPDSALAYAKAHGIDYAIVTTSDLNDPDTLAVIQRYETFFKHWLIVPYFAQNYSLWVHTWDLNGVLGLELTHRLLKRTDRTAKRTMDLALTLLGSIVVLPLSLLIALAIKLDSPGPVLYSQTRLGKNGKPFPAFKFRSMIENADEILHDYLLQHPELEKEWQATQKLKKDPRITRLGKFLRRTSLDELPQLLNVLRGEMSLVGPRPIVKDEIQRYGWVWNLYQRVRPGITGQWQISGRNDTTYQKRTDMDAYYVRNWSVWLDIYILARTFKVVLKRDGAY